MNPGIIRHLSVSRLFGRQNYNLEFGRHDLGRQSHLTLLYGDNGTGKTTLLRLMYHALSRRRLAGSRSYLSQTPFRTLRIELDEGQAIEIVKHDLVGAMNIKLEGARGVENLRIVPNEQGAVTPETSRADLLRFEDFLSSLKIEQLYLSDDRRIMTTYLAMNDELLERRRSGEIIEPGSEKLARINLDWLANRVLQSIRNKVITESVFGQSNVHHIYLDVAKRLAGPQSSSSRGGEVFDAARFNERVRKISAEYNKASALQIFPVVDFSEVTDLVAKATRRKVEITEILETYLDTIEARLNAVKEVSDLLNSLLEQVNSFLVNKRLSFSFFDGFKVTGLDDEIKFYQLSSGERQLIFLIFVCFMTRDDKSIVYIDEPELSLNIKWQRNLLSSLLTIIRDTPTQLIAATHSFEILAKHRTSIVDLNRLSQNVA